MYNDYFENTADFIKLWMGHRVGVDLVKLLKYTKNVLIIYMHIFRT